MSSGGRRGLARAISIAGHPAVAMTLAALSVALSRGAPFGRPAIILGAVVASVLAFSWLQVRRSAWEHVDASRPEERRTLNLALAVAVGGGGLAAWLLGEPQLAAGLVAGASIVALAAALAPWLKLSQHVAFASMAALISAQALGWWLLAVFLPMAVAVGWSRLQLARHTLREVVVGSAAGALAFAAWRALLSLST